MTKREYHTKIDGKLVMFWYNSKTHKYEITVDEFYESKIYSKAKGEAIIDFIKWFFEAKE